MKVLHICTECYPAAKAGGMGDVVGALPQYLANNQVKASVVIPKYSNQWFKKHTFNTVFKGQILLGLETVDFQIQRLATADTPFGNVDFYCVAIKGKFDRATIYLDNNGNAFADEIERNLSFQIAILQWLKSDTVHQFNQFDLLHCHDHMTGLIPFFVKYGDDYRAIAKIPIVFTIHNGQYRGTIDWSYGHLLPNYHHKYGGLLDWDNCIHSLATAIKCANSVTTVSNNYLLELQQTPDQLTSLYQSEADKCVGIINGIDEVAWNPQTDSYLKHQLQKNQWRQFKKQNKKHLLQKCLNSQQIKQPVFSFIGRFAFEKGADVLALTIELMIKQNDQIKFIILGSGDKHIEKQYLQLQAKYPSQIAVTVAYDEAFAHQIYAGSDFLLMPSRFEPCGLNQMYAMRYGTIPIVRKTGGLADTVIDLKYRGSTGLTFLNCEAVDIEQAIQRALILYNSEVQMSNLIRKITRINFSWEKMTQIYTQLYQKLL